MVQKLNRSKNFMEIDSKNRTMLELVINQIFLTSSYGCARVSTTVIRTVLDYIINVLKNDQTLVEMNGDVTIVGDLHGQMVNLVRALSAGQLNPTSKFVFLGDYVDRGQNSLEVIVLLYALKILYPNNICLLRGNHEAQLPSEPDGFYCECCKKANTSIYEEFIKSFDYLPLAAIVNKSIFCVHGGISPHLDSVQQIREIRRPIGVPLRGLITDLLWSDPDPKCYTFGGNPRGQTVTWGKISSDRFLKRNHLKMIVRGHQVAIDGYKYPLTDRSVVTLFTASDPSFMASGKSCVMKVFFTENSYKFIDLNEKTPKISIFSLHADPNKKKSDALPPPVPEKNLSRLTRNSSTEMFHVKKEQQKPTRLRRANSFKVLL